MSITDHISPLLIPIKRGQKFDLISVGCGGRLDQINFQKEDFIVSHNPNFRDLDFTIINSTFL